jgi:2-keto-4-pentenoate hydratase/2-oxohepta-3-ene-1,7-dioic acid hydratase in catechol pathway
VEQLQGAREKLNLAAPQEPLYLIKTPNSYLEPGGTIRHPGTGKVVYEGELGIVIGKRCKQASEDEAMAHVFGYTCANDVTVADILNRDASFAQWVARQGLRHLLPLRAGGGDRLDPRGSRCARCSTAWCGRTTRSATCAFPSRSW